MLDVVIHGGSVVDGSGAAASQGDVGIVDGRIVEVGRISDQAKVTIDAEGLVVAPGFIDLHSHYDAQLFWDPTLSPSPLHGVTTAVSGNCGLTLAPAAPDDRDFLTRLLARVEAIPVEALLAGVRYEWESFAELLDVVEAKPLALNIGFMVGHSAIRRAVMGPAASTDKASPDQIAAMRGMLGAALAAGGFGFSTANVATQVDGDGRPTPPNLADPQEFIELAAECGLHPGTSIEFIPGSFLVGFSDDDIALMADMSAAADRHLNWNTPLINPNAPGLYQRQLDASDFAKARGGRIVPMFMPQNGPLRHDFKEAYVFRAVPGWADVFTLEGETRVRALSDPAVRAQLKASVDAETQGLAVVVRNWASYEVNDVADPALSHLLGRNIGELAAERGVSPFDAMLDVVVEAKLDVGFVRYQYPDDEWIASARLSVLKDPRVVLGASDAGAHGEMMVGADFPTRCIGELVREKEIFTVEEMVHQFSDVTARLYGLKDRGRIEAGMWGDLVLFDLSRIGAGPMKKVSDLPAGASRLTTESTGVEHVLNRGTEVVRHGQFTGDLPGRLLRSGRDTTTVTAR